MRLLIFLLSANACFGQLTMQQMQPFFNGNTSTSVPGPNSIPGLALWWVSSDLPVNPKVSVWTDRIQGKLWTNNNTGKQPTNSLTGVYFDGSTTVLTNDGSFKLFSGVHSYTIYAVVKCVQDGNGATQRAFFSQPNNTATAGLGVYWFNHLCVNITGGTTYFVGITNNYQDFIFQSSNVGNTWRTNNVVTANGSQLQSGADFTMFNLGQNPSVANGWFYLAEIGLYTNDLTAGQMTTLHTYATNTYSYAP